MKHFFRGQRLAVMFVLLGMLFAGAVSVYAATTIGTDISTGGSLTVTGTTTVDGFNATGQGILQPGGGDGSNVLMWLDEDSTTQPYAFNVHMQGQSSTDFGYGNQDSSGVFHLGATNGNNYPEIQFDAPNNAINFSAPMTVDLNASDAYVITPTRDFFGNSTVMSLAPVDMGGYSLIGNRILMGGSVTNEAETAGYETDLVGPLAANRLYGFNVRGSVGGAALTAPFNIGGIINGSSHWDLGNSGNYAGFNQAGMVITSGHTLSGYWRGFSAVPPTLESSSISGEVDGLYLSSFANGPGATNYAIHSAGGTTLFQTGAASTVGMQVERAAGQTADLLQLLDNDGTTVLSTFDKNGSLGIGTSTPQGKLQVTAGANATTTVTIGELGLTSSKGCVNINASDGSASSFYVNAAHQLVVEANYCR
jgi:hypothetical protein